jgi:glycosyltransferase involved in cell wall biosynthesis
MKVSVIIPVYNAAAYVAQAVQSALQQPETGEVLLIEDGSPDNALTVCRELAMRHPAVRLLTHPDGKNHGAGASRNLGILSARWEYIAFLDADDLYLPGRFSGALEILCKHPEVDGVYGATGVMFEDPAARHRWHARQGPENLTTITEPVAPEDLFFLLVHGGRGRFTTDAIVVRRTLFEKAGLFDEQLLLHQDTAMWIKMAAVGRLVGCSADKPVAVRRVHTKNRFLVTFPGDNRSRKNLDELLYTWARQVPLNARYIEALRYRQWRNGLFRYGEWQLFRTQLAGRSVPVQVLCKTGFIAGSLLREPRLIFSRCLLWYVREAVREFFDSTPGERWQAAAGPAWISASNQVPGRQVAEPLRKILYIGFVHRILDARLYYRQIITVLERYEDIECVYAGHSSLTGETASPHPRYRILDLQRYHGTFWFNKAWGFLKACVQERPDWVQASDVKELIPAYLIHLGTGARIIYDAHEDYFNQAFEYSGNTPVGLLSGIVRRLIELSLVRTAEAVFCTDPYLRALYTRPVFGANKVFLLHNFVNSVLVDGHARPPQAGETLRIVYIGTVNAFRGIRRCAELIDRYNQESGRRRASIDVYAPAGRPLIEKLEEEGLINFKGYLNQQQLFQLLPRYHVGICLLDNIQKYHRNLPTKNFEYMAAGVPVLTSDFGHMAEYVKMAGAGVCIDPQDYTAFRQAVDTLQDPQQWREFSRRGREATRDRFSLERELAAYLDIFTVPAG